MVPYGRCSSGDVREHDDTRRTVCNPLQDGEGAICSIPYMGQRVYRDPARVQSD